MPLPGAADLALFAELARAEADLVVLDAGPLEAMAALVALPAALRWWLDQLMPPGLRALGAVRTAAVAAGAAKRGPVDAALAAVPVVEELLAARPAGRAATTVCLVAEPRRGVGRRRCARRSPRWPCTACAAGAVLARVLPPTDAGEWWAAAGGRAGRRPGRPRRASRRCTGCPRRAVAPADVDELVGLLDGFDAPGGDRARRRPRPSAHERRLAADRAAALRRARPACELTRWVDDLVVTVGGARRSLRLDALLRRCEVTGGRLVDPGTADARLVVGFRPDPQLWPADLLAAEAMAPKEETS